MTITPTFTVLPTSKLDKIHAKQLEAIFNLSSNQKVYQELVAKTARDVLKEGQRQKDLYA